MAGAPRFKHKGKVILFDLSEDGDVSITQAIEGEQVKIFFIYQFYLIFCISLKPYLGVLTTKQLFSSLYCLFLDWLLFWQ